MKKFAAVVILAFLGFSMQAQGIDIGVKAGVNFATLSDASGLENRTGFVAGAFVGFKLSDKVGVQGELLYSQQGAELDLGEFDLDYVNIPVFLKYFVSSGLNIQLGPQFGFLVNDETRTVLGNVIQNIEVNDFDVSALVGVGYDFPMGLRIDGRYNFGLSDVPELGSGKNSVITIALGYSFL